MERLRRIRAAQSSLLDFTLYTKPDYRPSHFHRELCSYLDAVMRGDIKRLMVMVFPRSGKSELVSRRLPAFFLGKYPGQDIITASYGKELSTDFSRDVRNLVQSAEYQRLFPGTELAPDSQAKDRWHTARGGSYVAAGVGTTIVGRGANLFDIDDPIKSRAEAESETYRKAIWDWYRAVVYTRLQPNAAIVLTHQRWHENDLAGMLLQEEANGTGDKWVKLIYPALNEFGESLWPEHFSVDDLKRIRAVIGEHEWAALYEQRPRPPGGSFFSASDLLVDGKPIPLPLRYDTVFATIDTAVKTGKDNDGVGCVYWARSRHFDPPLVIIDWELRQMEGALLETWLPTVFRRLEEYAQTAQARLGSAGAFVEDKASGMVLLQQAARNGWPAHPIESRLTAAGKSERAITVSGHVYAGRVKMSEAAYNRVSMYKGRNRNHLLSQVLDFRAGTKDMGEDDLLDCFSYGIALGLDSSKVNNI